MQQALRFLLAVGALGATACTAPRDAVRYSGQEYPKQSDALELEALSELPVGFEVFGKLQSTCELWGPDAAVDGRWLADLDCTERRLWRALRDKAASVGAELLVNARCGSMIGGGKGAPQRLTCRAAVARADAHTRGDQALSSKTNPTPSLAANAAQAQLLDDPTGSEAWRIKVYYHPAERAVEVQPEPSASAAGVVELSAMPPSHVALGSLVTTCEDQCTAPAMRASLRVAASRLGATDVVGVRCLATSPGWHCTGTLALPRDQFVPSRAGSEN